MKSARAFAGSATGVATDRESPSAPAALKAPLFASLMEPMQEGERRVLLELGTPRSGTLALLSQYRCKLHVVGIDAELLAVNALEEEAEVRSKLQSLLKVIQADDVDIVLCWDLLNYLEKMPFAVFLEVLAGRLHPGIRVHGLFSYTSKQIPVQPGVWYPTDAGHLVHVPMTEQRRHPPAHLQESLNRRLSGFKRERAVLLHNGMQELLLRL